MSKVAALANAQTIVDIAESIQAPPVIDPDWHACAGNPIERVKPIYRNAAATEAAPYQTFSPVIISGQLVHPVPWRAFSRAVMDRNGLLWYIGGGDGDYPSGEGDVFDTATQQWRTPVNRPHVPPEPPYNPVPITPYNAAQGAGGGYAVWNPLIRNPAFYGWDGTTGDPLWEMATIHGYGRVSCLPGLGFVCYAGFWTPAGLYSANGLIFSLASWNPARVGNQWLLHDPEHWNSATQQTLSSCTLSEFDETIAGGAGGLYGFGTSSTTLYVKRFRLDTMLWESVATYANFGLGTNGGCSAVYLGGGEHLLLRIGQSTPNMLFRWRPGAAPAAVPIPSEYAGYVGPANSAARLYATADRDHGRVYFGYSKALPAATAPLELAVASIANLDAWTAMEPANKPMLNAQSGPNDRAPIHYYADNVYALLKGPGGGWPQTSGVTLSRIAV